MKPLALTIGSDRTDERGRGENGAESSAAADEFSAGAAANSGPAAKASEERAGRPAPDDPNQPAPEPPQGPQQRRLSRLAQKEAARASALEARRRREETESEDDELYSFLPARGGMLPQVLDAETHRRNKIISIIISLAILLLPPSITAIYYYGFATDRYEVSSIFSVRYAGTVMGDSKGMLGAFMGTVPSIRAYDESFSVVEFIKSRDAMRKVSDVVDIRAHFSDPKIDYLNRMNQDANFEKEYSYYGEHVGVFYDEIRNIIELRTEGYSPEIALKLSSTLISLSESLVNEFNRRSESDLLTLARDEVTNTQTKLREAEERLTAFRLKNSMLDPTSSSAMVSGIIAKLQGESATLQAQISALVQISRPDSPRLADLRNRLLAVQKQIDAEQARLTGTTAATANSDAPLAPYMEEYNLLTVQRDISRERYSSALAGLEAAMTDARRQQLYVVTVEAPHLPPNPTLPERGRIVLIVAVVTFIAWAVIRMLIAALRDHLV